jgi:hypothetical protein
MVFGQHPYLSFILGELEHQMEAVLCCAGQRWWLPAALNSTVAFIANLIIAKCPQVQVMQGGSKATPSTGPPAKSNWAVPTWVVV